MTRSRLAALWAGMAVAAAPLAAQPLDQCLAVCRAESGAACAISDELGVVEGQRPRKVDACTTRNVVKGPVRLRYKHKGKWFDSPSVLSDRQTFSQVTNAFPPDACSLPDPRCLQAQMQGKIAVAGGHGIDGQASTPGGTGEPCKIGLPCGRIAVPDGHWTFSLAEGGLSGTWRLRITRGAPPPGAPREFDVAVAAGRVHADGTRLAPGAAYAYSLLLADGSTRATGEFSLLSRPMMASLKTMAERRVAQGQGVEEAWIDTLAANELEWDAWQALRTGN